MRLLIGILSGLFLLWTSVGFTPHNASSSEPVVMQPVASSFLTPDPQDLSIFEQKIPIAQAQKKLAAQSLLVAQSFLGTPYVGGTLEGAGEEQLTINLRELDCWTFMENSLALALTAQSAQPTFDTFQHYIRELRYWGGTVKGYGSRIHYFSGWLLQAEKAGYLQDITRELGGIPYQKEVRYMSEHRDKYPRLKDPQTLKQIKQVEKRLSLHAWHYIPQHKIAQMESTLRDGDLIALTAWKRDLDVAHQGFALRKNGRVYLLHASSLGKRVRISAQPLARYIKSQKGQTGIMVARLK